MFITHLMLSSCLRIIGMWWNFYLTTVSWLFHTYLNIYWKWYFWWWVLYITSSTSLTAFRWRLKSELFLRLFWPGLCLVILLCFVHLSVSCLTPNASFFIEKCSCTPRIYDTLIVFINNNNNITFTIVYLHWYSWQQSQYLLRSLLLMIASVWIVVLFVQLFAANTLWSRKNITLFILHKLLYRHSSVEVENVHITYC